MLLSVTARGTVLPFLTTVNTAKLDHHAGWGLRKLFLPRVLSLDKAVVVLYCRHHETIIWKVKLTRNPTGKSKFILALHRFSSHHTIVSCILYVK